jgi:iron(III) transport system ATP-binding protein
MSIEVSNLRKTFGDAVAVAGIDVHVADGEMLVLLGPSGCGKTTTMRCIAGLEVPDSGRIAIGGRAVFDGSENVNVPINQRNVGMVFQSYAIWPHMTVFENVAYPLVMARRPRAEIQQRVAEILKLAGLEGFAERGASYLSGGQMQRIALARSLVMRPSVLLFDEPLSNLDARLRDHLRVQLRELQTQLKITSVYVTHDQREALALADQIAVMQGGTILQIGDPVSVYTRPKTSTIADFLGYSNIFAAQVIERGPVFHRVALAGSGIQLRVAALENGDGDRLAACIRPDDMTIREGAGGANLGDNIIPGEVVLASFMGSYMQYRVRVAGGTAWDVFSPDITSKIRLGSQVVLEAPADDILLLPVS